jgi:hypothetical protein
MTEVSRAVSCGDSAHANAAIREAITSTIVDGFA